MWPPWRRSPGPGPGAGRIHAHISSNFSCSSFKDIQQLCKEEADHPRSKNKKASVFHRVWISTSILRTWASLPSLSDLPPPVTTTTTPPPPQSNGLLPSPELPIHLAGADKRIIVYFTSLRVVRKTFEDCRSVRSILRGFRVSIDERDLSMDAGFLEELQRILGRKKPPTLPRVFIGGRYIGGADEVRQLHEMGELKKYIEGFPVAEPGVCEECGGYRFVLCEQCNGSHKCYTEKGGFRTCLDCNENGLIRCPTCSTVVL
ncbi:PREDICTED: uncharacterized protein At5g39865 [Nelumbo nucifera]|uniref:Uncharacterized protein At5g39865 n=1 Tax=Nelumbo nucifera TaxID=4432 RepID=A0A1U8APL2_NELNU|nr:PREDICTED: uncharacterized protein At5g39865 [Nelumbo nucifera]